MAVSLATNGATPERSGYKRYVAAAIVAPTPAPRIRSHGRGTRIFRAAAPSSTRTPAPSAIAAAPIAVQIPRSLAPAAAAAHAAVHTSGRTILWEGVATLAPGSPITPGVPRDGARARRRPMRRGPDLRGARHREQAWRHRR